MRGLILSCFFTLAAAAPQGYNYAAQQPSAPAPQPHQHYGPAQLSTNTASFLKDLQTVMTVQSANIESNFGAPQLFAYANNNDIVQYSSGHGATAPAQFASTVVAMPQARYLTPASAFDAAAFQQAQQQQHQLITAAEPETLISKRFYIHAAPEDEEEEVKQQFVSIGKARKSYNVVFIKAPAQAAQKTSLKIRPAVNEEKTVIYVLDKKHDASEVDAQVHEPATTTAKPEVYFIKYKTPEEAAHAQHTIQAQYDALGGSTHISNEGVATVSSVIGSLDAAKQADEAQAQVQEQEAQQVAAAISAQQQQESDVVSQAQSVQLSLSQGANNNGYLPPAKYYY